MTAVCNHCGASAASVLLSGMGAFYLCVNHDTAARIASETVPAGGIGGWVIVEGLEVTHERG